MSDIITTTQEHYRNRCIDLWGGLQGLSERMRDPRGQTAAEYMGVLLLVSTIIAAIFISEPGQLIAGKIREMIEKIVTPG